MSADPAVAVPIAPKPVHIKDWIRCSVFTFCGASVADLKRVGESSVRANEDANCKDCLSQLAEHDIAERALRIFNAAQPTLAGDR